MGCVNAMPVPAWHHTQNFAEKYTIEEVLGNGAFGQVLLVESKATKVEFVARMNHVDDHSVGDRLYCCASREGGDTSTPLSTANLWKSLGNEHPHIVMLHETFLVAGKHYAVMEKCEISLTNMMSNIRDLAHPYRNSADVARTFREMALGVAYVHSMGVLHRDVQPANFLFGGADGRTTKLGGFGLAIALPKAGLVDAPCASPTAFSSPEMLSGKPYSEPTDAWSFGVTLYLILFGSYPYVVISRTSTMKHAIITGHPTPSFRREDPADDNAPRSKLYTADASVLVTALMRHDHARRCSAEDALRDPFLLPKEERVVHAHDSRRAGEYRMLRSQTIMQAGGTEKRLGGSKESWANADSVSLSTAEGVSLAGSSEGFVSSRQQ